MSRAIGSPRNSFDRGLVAMKPSLRVVPKYSRTAFAAWCPRVLIFTQW